MARHCATCFQEYRDEFLKCSTCGADTLPGELPGFAGGQRPYLADDEQAKRLLTWLASS